MHWSVALIIAAILGTDFLPPRTNEWPLGDSITPARGYGQWNGWVETQREAGFHWAVDFHGLAGDTVYSPWHGQGIVLRVGASAMDSTEGGVLAERLSGVITRSITWDLTDIDGSAIPAGLYYISLESSRCMETRPLIVIK
jgi:hypothetical protein